MTRLLLLERDRQHHPWQSTRWAMSYNRGLPEPWQVHLGEPVDDRPLDRATRTRGRRKRRGD